MEKKSITSKISPNPIDDSSESVLEATLSLYINIPTPRTIVKMKRYLIMGYDLPPISTPRIITGMGLHDFPTTYLIGSDKYDCMIKNI